MEQPIAKEYGTAARSIANTLARRILEGEFAPGERFPTERELAVQFEVNRQAVREALKRLETLHLVRIQRGSGIYVENIDETAGIELLVPILLVGPGHVDLDALREYFEYRRIFFGEMVQLAAQRRSSEDCQALHEALELRSESLKDVKKMNDANSRLYRGIARASGNRIFKLITNTLERELHRFREPLAQSPEDARDIQQTWERVVEAIEGGDPEIAKVWADRQSDRLIHVVEQFWAHQADERG